MDSCDVLIVGGGPAGSSCAWQLTEAGLDAVVVDRSAFPRDKVCAGWITPQVVDQLQLDCDHYRRGRTLQPITGFRTGLVGGDRDIETRYGRTVSFGIRRCEFDHYLLTRSRARLRLGTSIASIRRERGRWIINDSISAPLLVGAGGHFCPVARRLNSTTDRRSLVAAREAEFPISRGDDRWLANAETPELYYCRDLRGYGWSFRKGNYLNVGLGRLDARSLPDACARFVAFLQERGRVPRDASWRWRGHAYLVCVPPHRRIVDDGVMLIGDAAGLAYAQSGEGIRPAIESGLLAAAAIAGARRLDTADAVVTYAKALRERCGIDSGASRPRRALLPDLSSTFGPWLLGRSWFVRHFVLDRWFLHARDVALPHRAKTRPYFAALSRS